MTGLKSHAWLRKAIDSKASVVVWALRRSGNELHRALGRLARHLRIEARARETNAYNIVLRRANVGAG